MQRIIPAVGLIFLGTLLSGRGAPEQRQPRIGFSSATEKAQFDAEKKLHQSISAQSIAALHKMITARPHMAGTPGGKAVADAIAGKLRSLGLTVEIDRHMAYLSYPKRLRATLLGSPPSEIPLREPVLKPDEVAAGNRDLTPGFVLIPPAARYADAWCT